MKEKTFYFVGKTYSSKTLLSLLNKCIIFHKACYKLDHRINFLLIQVIIN